MNDENHLVCGWDGIEFEFNRDLGAWQALYIDGNCVFSCAYPLDFEIEMGNGQVFSFEVLKDIVEEYNQDSMRVILTLGSEQTDLCIQHILEILSNPRRIIRQVRITQEGAQHCQFPLSIRKTILYLRGFTESDTAPIDMAAPMQRFIPGTSLREVIKRPRSLITTDSVDHHYSFLLTAPDLWYGTIAFHHMLDDSYVSITPICEDYAVRVAVYGDEPDIIIREEFDSLCYFPELKSIQEPVILAQQLIMPGGRAMHENLRLVSQYFSPIYAPPPNRPEWIQSANILEICPQEEGGFQGIMASLSSWRELGFNTLYLMPFHLGGYETIDYLTIDPNVGSEEELKLLVQKAHDLGFHVLFDLLVNITSPKSPYVISHPEWYYHTKDGQIMAHPVWKSCCLDPASPGFRQFLIEYTRHCCEEWGADGFRVDAVAHRGPPEQLTPLQPYQHSAAVFSLVEEIREAIRQTNPNRILMAECFGPRQVPISDLVCYQWVLWLHWILKGLQQGEINGKIVTRLLSEHFTIMPPHTFLVTYTHTHDTVAFAKEDIEGESTLALYTTLALLSAGTMVFAGGWRMRKRPAPHEKDFYRSLFSIRNQLGGIPCSNVTFYEDTNVHFLIAERPSQSGMIKLITNFSPVAHPLIHEGELIYSRLGSEPGKIAGYDTLVMVT